MKKALLNELKQLILLHTSNEEELTNKIPFLFLSYLTYHQNSLYHLAEPMLSIVVQGNKEIYFGKTSLKYSTGEYVVNIVDFPLSTKIEDPTKTKPFLAVGILLNPIKISEIILEINEQKSQPYSAIGIGKATAEDDLLSALVRLLKLLNNPKSIPILADALEREILWCLLNEKQGHLIEQLGLEKSYAIQIGKAIKWMRSNFDQKFQISFLAKLCGMSKTSFFRHFKKITAISPIQFQQQIRLREARKQLKSPLNYEGVAEVAMSVGYNSISQFTREYKKNFGITPGQDRTLRT